MAFESHRGAGVAVTLKGVSKRYLLGSAEVEAVSELDLHVESGSVVAITGRSGSGKSTLLRMIGGLERPDGGTIKVGEVVVTDLRGRRLAVYRRDVGFVFQAFHLLPALTALENVLVPLLARRRRSDHVARAREVLREVGLDDRMRSQPSQLSGGEQQRVAIARALVGRPSLMLADEPTGALDSATGKQILEQVLALREQHGMTLIVATHDDAVSGVCDRVVELRDGRVVADSARDSPSTDPA